MHHPSPCYRYLPWSLLFCAALLMLPSFPPPRSLRHDPTTQAGIQQMLAQLPLRFEPTRRAAEFVARGDGYDLALAPNEATLRLRRADRSARVSALKLRLRQAHPQAAAAPEAPGDAHTNYLIGDDPQAWRTNVAGFARVRYRDVYAGIDLVYYGQGRALEYDFIVAPGGDPAQIALDVTGADRVSLAADGALEITADGAVVQMKRPVIYQLIDGARQPVAGGYQIAADRRIGFTLGAYDRSRALVIDPVVNYATYFGGTGTDLINAIAVDSAGSIYIAGQTSSTNFPTRNALATTLQGATDAFVTKLTPQGNAIVFSTYLGGRGITDRVLGLAVDRGGNVYLAGETNSLNFPTVNAAQSTPRGNNDAFVAKLSNDGQTLIYSTYFGGSLEDAAFGLAIDRFDNAYVTGRTASTNLLTKSAFQPRLRGQRDAFALKLNPDGELVYATYLGGETAAVGARDDEGGYGIAVDLLQNAYITGYTTNANFPLANAAQTYFGGVEDAFITKLGPSGAELIYSTFVGGTRVDDGRGIALDPLCNVYITGYTLSPDFPRVNARQNYGGIGDAFVVKLNSAGTSFIYSTYLGGQSEENTGLINDPTPAGAILVDGLGFAYVTGKTESMDFPTARPIQSSLRGASDAFLAKLDPVGGELIYSTYFGSSFANDTGFDERGTAMALDSAGTLLLAGQVLKNDLQTVQPLQPAYGGGLSDAFLAKISTPDVVTIAPVSAASFTGAAFAPAEMVAAFGVNLASGTETATSVPLPTTLLGTSVTVRDQAGIERAAPLFFVSPGQVNFLIPDATPTGKAVITITSVNQTGQNQTVSATVLIDAVAPGIFTANSNGQGTVAAIALRVRADGSQSFEPVVRVDEQGKLVAVPIDLGPEGEQVFLILFGTGVRGSAQAPTALANVAANIAGLNVPVLYAGPQGAFIGQDQINVQLPRVLAGRGNVPLVLSINGALANLVTLTIK